MSGKIDNILVNLIWKKDIFTRTKITTYNWKRISEASNRKFSEFINKNRQCIWNSVQSHINVDNTNITVPAQVFWRTFYCQTVDKNAIDDGWSITVLNMNGKFQTSTNDSIKSFENLTHANLDPQKSMFTNVATPPP